jgi:DNA-binding PadR family transcriptional regulator
MAHILIKKSTLYNLLRELVNKYFLITQHGAYALTDKGHHRLKIEAIRIHEQAKLLSGYL